MMEYVLNYDSIVNEYCVNKDRPELMCNATCYLQTQLAKTVDQEQDKTNGNPIFNSLHFCVLQESDYSLTKESKTIKRVQSLFYLEPFSESFTENPFQPPIFG